MGRAGGQGVGACVAGFHLALMLVVVTVEAEQFPVAAVGRMIVIGTRAVDPAIEVPLEVVGPDGKPGAAVTRFLSPPTRLPLLRPWT